jgi:phosphoribosylformylglycinamidine synthase subunit PurS
LGAFFSILGGIVKAKIHVTLKQGILDPQGKAIEHALDSLGFKNAANVRVGKYMEVDLQEKDKAKAEAEVKQMCEKLLANTIVEEYRYELSV